MTPLFLLALLFALLHTTYAAHKEIPIADVHLLSWSPDAKIIAAGVKNTVILISTETGKKQKLPLHHDTTITAIAWDSLGSYMATADAKGKVCTYELTFLGRVEPFLRDTIRFSEKAYGHITTLALSAKGGRLAVGFSTGSVSFLSISCIAGPIYHFKNSIGSVRTLEWCTPYFLIGGTRGLAFFDIQSEETSRIIPFESAVTAIRPSLRKSVLVGLENGGLYNCPFGSEDIQFLRDAEHPILSISWFWGAWSVEAITTREFISGTPTGKMYGPYPLSQSFIAVALSPYDLAPGHEYRRPAVSDGKKIIMYDLFMTTDIEDDVEKPGVGSSRVRVYPNPTTDNLFVEVSTSQPEIIQLALVDYLGRECPVVFDTRQELNTSIYSTDTRSLPAGMHYLVLTTREGRTTLPVTIRR